MMRRLHVLLATLLLGGLLAWAVPAARADDLTFKVESNLRAAVAKVDITPPPGTPIAGHVRDYQGVRGALHAAVLLLDDGRTRAAIVTTDLLETGGGVTDAF